MPNLKISELPELPNSSTGDGINSNDYLTMLDVSETNVALINKKLKVSTLHEYLAPTNSPNFTGIPTVPTPPPGNNSLRIANTDYVQTEKSDVIDYVDTEITSVNTTITNNNNTLTNYIDTEIAAIKLDDINDVVASSLGSSDNNKYLSYNFATNDFRLVDKPGAAVGDLVKLQTVGGNPGLPAVNGANLTNLTIPSGAGSPLTTKGDLYVYGTASTRLGVGLDETTLVADSTTPTGLAWKQVQGTNLQTFATPISINFSLFDSYHGNLIRVNTSTNNVTVTLVAGVREGYQITLFKSGAINSLIINPNGQTFLGRGLNLVNDNSAASLSYNAATSAWFGIGDLS